MVHTYHDSVDRCLVGTDADIAGANRELGGLFDQFVEGAMYLLVLIHTGRSLE